MQIMRISVFLLPNSMLLIVHLSLVAFSLLLLCSTTSCLGSQYRKCSQDSFRCGKFHLSYPFGRNGSGCGDPEFQIVDCDDHSGYPMLNISGEQSRILDLFMPGSSMTIVNDNLFGSKCNLSVNYSQLWLSDSDFRISASTYTNLTLLAQCDKSNKEMSQLRPLPLCGYDWYYKIRSPEDGVDFCETFVEVPINRNDLSPEFTVNQALLRQGFGITWSIDQDRSRYCDSCSHSGGRCGFDISEPSSTFLCYCSDGSTKAKICPHSHGTFPLRLQQN